MIQFDPATKTYTLDREAASEHNLYENELGVLERYLNKKLHPGSFWAAVLTNDLSRSFGQADAANYANLGNIVRFMYNHFPNNAWGSDNKFNDFLSSELLND